MTTKKYLDFDYNNCVYNYYRYNFGINNKNILTINHNDECNITFDLPIIQELLKIANNKLHLHASYLVSSIPSFITVLYLDLEDYTDVTLDNLPPTLKKLGIFGEHAGNFNKPLINLPLTLEILIISSKTFNQSLALLPVGLKQLMLESDEFNQSLSLLPITLEYFRISQFLADKAVLNDKLLNLPIGIKYLYISKSYNLDVDLIRVQYPNLIEMKEIVV